jgi:hypothetical protein
MGKEKSSLTNRDPIHLKPRPSAKVGMHNGCAWAVTKGCCDTWVYNDEPDGLCFAHAKCKAGLIATTPSGAMIGSGSTPA